MLSMTPSHSSRTQNQCVVSTSHSAAIHLLTLAWAFLSLCVVTSSAFGQGANTGIMSSISCSAASITGAGTESCKVTLKYSNPGQLKFTLASSDPAVTVPATLSIPVGVSIGTFTARVAAVSNTQTATLSASSGNSPVYFSIVLKAASTPPPTPPSTPPSQSVSLTVNAASIAFGNVEVDDSATQSVTLTASGGTVAISSASATGTGFSASGLTFPVTLASGQSATLNVVFAPSSASSASGQLAIDSNGGNPTVSLSGTGYIPKVALAWDAPQSGSVTGYNIYRAPNGSSSYQQLNSSPDSATTYTDATVSNKETYQYYVVSVNSAGTQSPASNIATVAVP